MVIWNAKVTPLSYISKDHFSTGTKPYVQTNLALDFVIEKILILSTFIVFHGTILYGNNIYLF